MTNIPQESQIEQDREPIRMLGISGSLRKASFNTGLLRAAQEIVPDWVDFKIFDIPDFRYQIFEIKDFQNLRFSISKIFGTQDFRYL